MAQDAVGPETGKFARGGQGRTRAGGGGGGFFNPLAFLGGGSAQEVAQAVAPQILQTFIPRMTGPNPGVTGGAPMGMPQMGMGQMQGSYNTPASPGFSFLLNALQGRGWNPTPFMNPWGFMGSGGMNSFMGSMFARFGQPSAAYQGFLQSLQERRDARAGVPDVPPQGATSPSAQRRVPAVLSGRSY